MRIKQNSMKINQNSMRINQNSMRINQNPMRINQNSIKINQNSMKINQNSMRINQNPMRINQNSMRINQNSMRINQNSMKIIPKIQSFGTFWQVQHFMRNIMPNEPFAKSWVRNFNWLKKTSSNFGPWIASGTIFGPAKKPHFAPGRTPHKYCHAFHCKRLVIMYVFKKNSAKISALNQKLWCF